MKALSWVTAVALTGALPVGAQHGREWTIEGNVTTGAGPVEGAQVTTSGAERPAQVTTDSTGHYVLKGNASGRYLISAYHEACGPAKARSVRILPGAHIESLDFRLSRQSVIAGRVLDNERNPVQRASVAAWVKAFRNGRLIFLSRGYADTNDLGEYRIPDLGAGRYYVGVVPKLLQPRRHARPGATARDRLGAPVRVAFYPNAQSFEGAAPIILRAGEDREGTDIILGNADSFCIIATVVPPPGAASAQAVLQLYARVGDAFPTAAIGEVNPGEESEICGVPPGEYTFLATLSDRRTKKAIGFFRTEVSIARRDAELGKLSPAPGMQLRGRLTVEAQAPGYPLPRNIAVKLQRQGRPIIYGDNLTGVLAPSGTLTWESVFLDDYRLVVDDLPNGCYLQTAVQRARDVRQAPVRPGQGDLLIALSCDGGVVQGEVVDGNKEPVPDATVLLLPKEATGTDMLLSQQSDQNGGFEFSSEIAPGDYCVAAFIGLYEGEDRDPEFVSAHFSGCKAVTVPAKGLQSVTITARTVR